jgi:SAM-dependent methyltransferase
MSSEIKDFYDGFVDKLVRDFILGNPRTESAICFACDQLKKFRSKNILDLGFGLGWSAHEYARALPDSYILGIDLSQKLTKLAEVIFGDHSKVDFLCQDITDVGWIGSCTNTFNACVMLDVYEHVPRLHRANFHNALSSILTGDAILILACPTPLHQQYLRQSKPEGLQPVDEDVNFQDLLELSQAIGGTVVHLEHKSIWATNDYIQVVISRQLTRAEGMTNPIKHQTLGTAERLKRLRKAAGIIDRDIDKKLQSSKPSLFCRILNKFKGDITNA